MSDFDILVELPDTASGSEISPGHHSTRIVVCFNQLIPLAANDQTKGALTEVFEPKNVTFPALTPYYDNLDSTVSRSLSQPI